MKKRIAVSCWLALLTLMMGTALADYRYGSGNSVILYDGTLDPSAWGDGLGDSYVIDPGALLSEDVRPSRTSAPSSDGTVTLPEEENATDAIYGENGKEELLPLSGFIRLRAGRVLYKDKARKEQLGWPTEDAVVYATRAARYEKGALYELRFDTEKTVGTGKYQTAYLYATSVTKLTAENTNTLLFGVETLEDVSAANVTGKRIVEGVPLTVVPFHYGEKPTASESILTPASGYGYIRQGNTNLRSGPGRTWDRIAFLAKDTYVEIHGTFVNGIGDRWIYIVTQDGQRGFVQDGMISTIPMNTPAPDPEPTAVPGVDPIILSTMEPPKAEEETDDLFTAEEEEPEDAEDQEATDPEEDELFKENENENEDGDEEPEADVPVILDAETLKAMILALNPEWTEEEELSDEALLALLLELDPEALTEVHPEELPEEELTEEETPEALSLTLRSEGYVRAGQPLKAEIALLGGVAPYTLSLNVTRDGEEIYTDEQTLEALPEGNLALDYAPEEGGKQTLLLTVTDAQGESVQAEGSVLVSVNRAEREEQWARSAEVELTGDYARDLVAVARTQLGYEESKEDFVIAEDGGIDGYTRYGAFYGTPYTEWCATFVYFSMHYAELPYAEDFRYANVGAMRSQAQGMGIYRDPDYLPQAGDLVFVTVDGNPLGHMGIVESVDGETIHTIQGNVQDAVVRRDYPAGDARLSGFASLGDLVRETEAAEEQAWFPVEGLELAAQEGVLRIRWTPAEGQNFVVQELLPEGGYRILAMTEYGETFLEQPDGGHIYRVVPCRVGEGGQLIYGMGAESIRYGEVEAQPEAAEVEESASLEEAVEQEMDDTPEGEAA